MNIVTIIRTQTLVLNSELFDTPELVILHDGGKYNDF